MEHDLVQKSSSIVPNIKNIIQLGGCFSFAREIQGSATRRSKV